jgi:DNA-binding XRE family transcriptional regulator
MKTYTLEEMTDKYIGKKGTVKRNTFEEELRLDILGQTIRNIREKRHLTQSELGGLIGVQKSQISKVENNVTDARFETVLKVFKALGAKVKFNVELT